MFTKTRNVLIASVAALSLSAGMIGTARPTPRRRTS